MATNFPNSPSNGDTHTFGGATYTYNSARGAWLGPSSGGGGGGGGGASVTSSDTAPSSPSAGDLWYKSDTNALYVYYTDADSSQWVGVSGPAGAAGADGSATSYTNLAGFPSSGNSLGDFAVAEDTKALYMWDGTEWDRIVAGSAGESPIVYTEPPTSHNLNNDGSTSTVQMQAVDPEGTAITYGIVYANSTNARPDQLAADTVIDQATGTYTFDPSASNSNEGSFKARLSATDGITSATRFVNFNLLFSISTSYLIVAGGGSGGVGNTGGAGGAGGLLYASSHSFETNVAHTITVGAGGAAKSGNGAGNSGQNSSIGTITAIGGGGGGGNGAGPLVGGSGGGGPDGVAGAAGTAGQGNAGGLGDYTAPTNGTGYGGSGGGAGAAGGSGSDQTSEGGVGLEYNITGTATYYAGGGGGGGYNNTGRPGGNGGGGDGGNRYGGAVSGTANTGGGGGGDGLVSGAGGSGIVIIRAPRAATSTTGSPAVTTVGSDTVYTFTSNGSITF